MPNNENDDVKELNFYIDNLIEGSDKLLIRNPREKQINDLKSAYIDNRLVLVLGAGIATQQGLPDWTTLLQKLLFNTVTNQNIESKDQSLVIARIFVKLFSTSSLIAGRYLKYQNELTHSDDRFRGSRSFEEAVKAVLYEKRNGEVPRLFHEIRHLCEPLNDKLNSVVTYNYDDLLESYFSNEESKIPHRSIYSSTIKCKDGEIPIYHVHGFLPHAKRPPGNIIFSEDLYHEQYNDSYSWSNFIQIDKFTNFICLFIGISLTDPNMRRLLDISKNLVGESKIQHYIIREEISKEKTRENLRILLKNDDDLLMRKKYAGLEFGNTYSKLIDLMKNFQEKDAESFNIGTIWVDDYSEIPEILSKIRV